MQHDLDQHFIFVPLMKMPLLHRPEYIYLSNVSTESKYTFTVRDFKNG